VRRSHCRHPYVPVLWGMFPVATHHNSSRQLFEFTPLQARTVQESLSMRYVNKLQPLRVMPSCRMRNWQSWKRPSIKPSTAACAVVRCRLTCDSSKLSEAVGDKFVEFGSLEENR